MLAPSGYVSEVDPALCEGCGACVDVCPFEALLLESGVARVDADGCMGCGVCAAQCVPGALSLRRDVEKGEPLDVRSLTADRERVRAGLRAESG
jgi:ferredoxin